MAGLMVKIIMMVVAMFLAVIIGNNLYRILLDPTEHSCETYFVDVDGVKVPRTNCGEE